MTAGTGCRADRRAAAISHRQSRTLASLGYRFIRHQESFPSGHTLESLARLDNGAERIGQRSAAPADIMHGGELKSPSPADGRIPALRNF